MTPVKLIRALAKPKLSTRAKQTILKAEEKGQLFCCDISLWEIAMLIQKKRLAIQEEIQTFLNLLLKARQIKVLDINANIAALSITHPCFQHSDPAAPVNWRYSNAI